MKILIYGECDSIGSGAWCYKESLKDMGYEVTYFLPDHLLTGYTKIFWKIIKKINNGIIEFHRKKHIVSLLNEISQNKFDVLFVLKGLLISKFDIEKIKKLGIYTILINHDDVFSAFKNSRSKIQFECLPYYDQVYVTKEINYHELLQNIKSVKFIPFSFYPKIHSVPDYDLDDKNKWGYDLLFVGSCYESRKNVLEYLVKNLPSNIRIGIFGNGWNKVSKFSLLKKHITNKVLNYDEMRKAFYYSKISIGFLCKENRDDHTQRTFEIPACGGLLLAERTIRHENFYPENESAVFFDIDNYSDALSKINILLKDNNMIEKIKSNGSQRILELNATYEDRLKEILNLLPYKYN
jgi:spore maturation protein CgeB